MPLVAWQVLAALLARKARAVQMLAVLDLAQGLVARLDQAVSPVRTPVILVAVEHPMVVAACVPFQVVGGQLAAVAVLLVVLAETTAWAQAVVIKMAAS